MVTKATSNSTLSFNYVVLLLTRCWHIQITLSMYSAIPQRMINRCILSHLPIFDARLISWHDNKFEVKYRTVWQTPIFVLRVMFRRKLCTCTLRFSAEKNATYQCLYFFRAIRCRLSFPVILVVCASLVWMGSLKGEFLWKFTSQKTLVNRVHLFLGAFR